MLSESLLALMIGICGMAIVVPHLTYYSYIRTNLKPSSATRRPKNCAMVSVLVCTLNAAKNIQGKVEQILRQGYTRSRLELIVVDGGSIDGTVELLRRIREKLPPGTSFTLVENHGFRGKASQINEGFRIAKGEIVITTDVDVKIEETAIEDLVDSLADNEIGAVCARQVLTNPQHTTVTRTEAKYRSYYELLRIGESNIHSTPIFHGGLSAFRKKAVSRIDEDVNADDTQLALAAVRNGYRAVYESDCVFFNESPEGLGNAWRQRVRRGQGLQRVFWRNRDMIFDSRYQRFGSVVYPVEFFMHLISPLLFAGEIILLLLLCSSSSSSLTTTLIGLLATSVLTVFLLFRRRSAVELLMTFVLYQMVLVWAMILHMVGRNYVRWSRFERVN
jgi:cellulose synthase/poly-beta-1,6-N-acetylglucosamine synthase-like glycosyltransferase